MHEGLSRGADRVGWAWLAFTERTAYGVGLGECDGDVEEQQPGGRQDNMRGATWILAIVTRTWHRGNMQTSPSTSTMARRTAVVEEFDDDTDLPLPSRPLANARGPLLEEIGDDDSSDNDESAPGPASQPSPKPPSNTITDITPYKKYASPLSPSLSPSPEQMDLHISNIHRRKAALWQRRTQDRTREMRLVAPQQGHCRRYQPPRSRHAARGEQGPPARLGEPWSRACPMEEGRAARQHRY